MIVLFTDFGWRGPYVGQMRAVLARNESAPAVIDLMHDVPPFSPRAGAHLLAALAEELPAGTVVVGVVDPGVGTERPPVIVQADDRWYVGPGNGLFDVVAARAEASRWWRITRAPERSSATFHGRDLFAPVAAVLARGEKVPGEPIDPPPPDDAKAELAEVIYIDHYGNAMTGLRAPKRADTALRAGGHELAGGRTFADARPGEGLWLVNSLGLVEIAVNQASAADAFGLSIGSDVAWADRDAWT